MGVGHGQVGYIRTFNGHFRDKKSCRSILSSDSGAIFVWGMQSPRAFVVAIGESDVVRPTSCFLQNPSISMGNRQSSAIARVVVTFRRFSLIVFY